MQIKPLIFLLLIIFAIGVFGTGNLAYSEFTQHYICPVLLGIPACYIIFICFVIPFISHFYSKNNVVYFVFSGFAFIVALVASIMQFSGLAVCPKTNNGTPMCYYSLLLFTSLIILKLQLIKKKLV